MRLIIDFGNTLKKIAIFDKNELIKLYTYENFELEHLKSITKNHPHIQSAIISSVIHYPKYIGDYLESNYFFMKLNSDIPIPIINKYKSPSTLGNDRIAAVVAATEKYKNKNLLVIDAGSCITFDFINKDKEYLGGAISPGILLRFKALNNFTDKLPLLEPENIDYLIGETTDQSILSGVINGITAEIDGVIDSYKEIYNNLTIIMSGGDYKYFDKRLKNNIFALPNIVLFGLNVILDFNELEKK
jgi:type III pantothenate kinase